MKRKRILTDDEIFEIKAQEYEKGLKDGRPKVTRKFIKKWSRTLIWLPLRANVENWTIEMPKQIEQMPKQIEQMLIEAGVEVEK